MLTDEEIVAALQGAFDDATADICPPSELVSTTCRRQRNRHRRIRAVQVALPVAVVVAITGTALSWHGPRRETATVVPSVSARPSTSKPAAASPLDGYHLQLPISFVSGTGPANCPSHGGLTATERTRLYTAPGARCPFLVRSVLTKLPAGMIEVSARTPSGERVTFYRGVSADGRFYNSYVAVRRSTGGRVYVLIDPLQGALTLQQYADLADGAIATPA